MGSRSEGASVSCDAAVRNPLLLMLLIACLITALILVHLLKGRRGQTHVGLVLSFLSAFWVNHWFSVSTYLVPGYCGVFPELMIAGVRESLYGLLGFTAGVFFLPKFFGFRDPAPQEIRNAPAVPASLRYGLLVLGILSYIALQLAVKGVQSVFAVGQNLMVVAVVLSIWEAARRKQSKTVTLWLILSLAFPFTSIIHQGFLSSGIASLAPVCIFAATCIGRKNFLRAGIFGGVALYLGLSLYVNYMRDRKEIRSSVWGGADVSSRVERFAQIFENFEWFSPANPAHLDKVATRMNMNWLVGAGVAYMENTKQWASGETLKYAALGFIPRVLWPGKPEVGGSGLASRYTGLQFSEGTSVSMGFVLEFYVNYGSWLVFFGFAAIGGLLAYLDGKARNGLNTGNCNRFVVCFVVGLALQAMSNALMPMVTGAVVGVMLTYALQMVMRMKARRMPPAPAATLRSYAGSRAGI